MAGSPEAWLGGGAAGAAQSPARLEVVSRAGCHLCERTAAQLEPVAERYGASLVLVDVDADPALAELSDHVPVVRLDGVEVDRLMVDVAAVERALAAR
ncbi:glutaredoxin family protein [Georgenia sp. Z1344]|uniref:glutaredoxin family protein n=1 Tax=Georgenia sp. Z1344 TaxID=3416706 RepID=UPI003CEFA26F